MLVEEWEAIPQQRVTSMYELRRPVLFVMEPDMLKTILVKECFTYFTNRLDRGLVGDLYDAVGSAKDDHWRRIRNILTPIFTSGRIKEMFNIVKHHSRKLTDSLQSKALNKVITVKHVFGAYTIDVMASTAFSIDADSINDPSGPLMTHSTKLFSVPNTIFLLSGMFPFCRPLLELLGYSMFSKTSTGFFKTLMDKVKAERNGSSHQYSGDFLQYMMNCQTASESKTEKQNTGLTDHEIFSQATIFMFAGYETSTNTLVFVAYTLARHPEVMKRLQEEIDSTFPNKGEVEYEALMQMAYLDCVVNEVLRLYPPSARLERTAKETVYINGITIPKGMDIMVPVYAMHHDPELWPEPEEFKPDRFSKQNKQNIEPYTYLPFGVGPRNCLGMRFALLIVKLSLVNILQNFSFSVCEETEIPLKMSYEGLTGPLRPIKLKLVPRSTTSGNVDKSD
ncbi:cytochrome P450 3A30-like isoform X2 [Centropristis striata]|uniref:cytochrome P450 3A30-like isoform X2 n=1 Tax=Centropristis striata TaxID=184440 RepID=UPI0027E0F332|nr:cytochrome P450 3A30-like isoform X2 [Centropristis striata]